MWRRSRDRDCRPGLLAGTAVVAVQVVDGDIAELGVQSLAHDHRLRIPEPGAVGNNDGGRGADQYLAVEVKVGAVIDPLRSPST